MPKIFKKPRKYEVHSRYRDTVTARVVEDVSLEAAAIAFVENFGGRLHQPDEHRVTVYVRDLAGGVEHCMCIDLESGQAQPCT